MVKLLTLALFLIVSVSCSRGVFNTDMEKNLEQLDKTFGKCDNPYRQYTKGQKKICKDKLRAAGPDGTVDDPINITELIEKVKMGGETVYASTTVNPNLWNASLALLDPYSLKIVDSQGGVIVTDWIIEKENPNKRCSIKINITSTELVSNGVRVKLICETKDLDSWYSDQNTYIDEEKKMTLKILEIANTLKLNQELSK